MKIPTVVYYAACLLPAHILASAQQAPSSPVLPADAAETRQEIRQVEKMLASIPDRGPALYLLAHDHAHLGELERALDILKECMSLEEGFDPEGDPAFAPVKETRVFRTLIDRVHQRYPVVHRARAALTIAEKDLIPEGLAVNLSTRVLYLGSLNLRKIVQIAANGDVSDFVRAGQYQVGPICGLKVDSTNDTLWANVCPDSGAGAELLHFDTAGKLVERFPPPTSGGHLFNDLVLRGRDEIYLTDSLANLVYRFDRHPPAPNQCASQSATACGQDRFPRVRQPDFLPDQFLRPNRHCASTALRAHGPDGRHRSRQSCLHRLGDSCQIRLAPLGVG